jgi:hypothetical protein
MRASSRSGGGDPDSHFTGGAQQLYDIVRNIAQTIHTHTEYGHCMVRNDCAQNILRNGKL